MGYTKGTTSQKSLQLPVTPMKTLNAFLAIALLLCIANFSHATIINFKEAPISAVGDGTTDNRPAITRAFALLKSGDTLLIPSGDYRIVLTKGSLTVPPGSRF